MFWGKKNVLLSHKFVKSHIKYSLVVIVVKMSGSFYESLIVCQVVSTITSLWEVCTLKPTEVKYCVHLGHLAGKL